MTKHKKFKRRLFVNKKLQALFSLYITVGFILATLFFSYEFIKTYFSFWGFNPDNYKLLSFLNNPHVIRIIILIIFTSVWYGLSIILTTNKFVGPLIRLNNIIKDMQKGNFNINFRFRKNDKAYKETEKLLNELLTDLNDKKNKRNQLLKDCEKDLLFLSNKIKYNKEQQDEILETFSDLKHSINECKKL